MTQTLYAVGTPVVDYVYANSNADHALREAFFRFLDPANPPRDGDNRICSAEQWTGKLLNFAATQAMATDIALSDSENALRILQRIFGAPTSVEAGGALANTFAVMITSQINNKSFFDGSFVTALGEGESGVVFEDSLKGHVNSPPPKGLQLVAQVFQTEKDRIIYAVDGGTHSSHKNMSPSQIDAMPINADTTMVMLDGYMYYTGQFEGFRDAILRNVAAVSDDPYRRPTIVLTTGAQFIAEQPILRSTLDKSTQTAPTVVCANTGEFRRLMGLDTAWREPFAHRWEGLDGHALEEAKQADAEYIVAKNQANQVAFKAAYDLYCAKPESLPATCVVTNGKYDVHVVSAEGVHKYDVPKAPHGVVNKVGVGDAFAGGYLLGHANGLKEQDCIQLAFIASGEVIAVEGPRLKPRSKQVDLGVPITFSGLLAYFDHEKPVHADLLLKLHLAADISGLENERNFLVANDSWKVAATESCFIKQHYLPDFSEGGIRIAIDKDNILRVCDGQNRFVGNVQIPPQEIKKFGEHNLVHIRRADGFVPVGEGIEARVRFMDDVPYIAIKADTAIMGSRRELQFQIPDTLAHFMAKRCPDYVTKIRHYVPVNGRTVEVNQFQEDYAGLITAEIESERIGGTFARPAWLGREITGCAIYANRMLAKRASQSRRDCAL